MRSLVLGLVVTACGGGPSVPSGTYQVQWQLDDSSAPAAPSCATYKIDHIDVTAADTITGDTDIDSFPCEAGMGALTASVGSHHLTFEAIGTAGDVAGDANNLSGSIASAGQTVVLAPVTIDILAPATSSHTTWTLRANGAAASCAQIANTGVAVTTTASGAQPVVDLWNCDETNATVDVAYGAFTVKAELLGNGTGAGTIGSSQTVTVDAARGLVTVPVTIDAN